MLQDLLDLNDSFKPQTLESVVSIGLLIFLCAKMQDDKFVVPSMELILSCISKPSILSHILIDELFSREASPMNLAIMNSGSCPEDFQPDPFFTEYYTNFLPPIYADIAERIENEKGISFIRQWAFEWHKILENEGREPSASSLSYLYEQRYSDHTVVVDVELSEIYRSAYLRALAWTNMIEALSENEAIYLALETCPIDFGLWYLMPTSTPDWWPKVGKTEDTNGIASKIWEQVDILWDKQQTKNDIWVIVEASGIVYEGDIICDLRINGIFQKASKLLNHSFKDIDIGKFNNEIIYDPFGSGLIFEGIIAPDTNYINNSSSGREELHVAYLARPQPFPRWQFWRMFRGIWLPSPELSPQILTFKCSNDGVIVSDGYDIIAKWSDWRERIKEKATANLPPATGQCLLIRRKNIEDFSRNCGLLFCWVCSLTSYQRKNNFQDYTISDDDCRIKTPYIGEEPTI